MKFAGENDLAALARIQAASFEEHWDEAALRTLLGSSGVFALTEDEGFILVRVAADEAEILTLAVLPPDRRAGLGRMLAAAAASEAHRRGAKHLFLEVGAENHAARGLYASLGFAEIGRRPGYYRTAQGHGDALILRADLPLALGNGPQLD